MRQAIPFDKTQLMIAGTGVKIGIAVCVIAIIYYYVRLIVRAFSEGIFWGLLSLFVPFFPLIFAMLKREAAGPFLSRFLQSIVLLIGIIYLGAYFKVF